MEDKKVFGIITEYNESKFDGSTKSRFGVALCTDGRKYELYKEGFRNYKTKISNETPIVFFPQTYFRGEFYNEKKLAYLWKPISTKEDLEIVLDSTNYERYIEYEVRVYDHQKPSSFPFRKISLNILVISLAQIFNGKNEKTAMEYLLQGLKYYLNTSDVEKIAYYYNSVKESIHRSNFNFSKSFLLEANREIKNYSKGKSENFFLEKLYFKKKVLCTFNKELHEFQKFKIWQLGEFMDDSEELKSIPEIIFCEKYSTKKVTPIFDEEVFENFCNELKPEDFHRLKYYRFKKKTKKKLITKFLNNKYDDFFNFSEALFVVISMELLPEYFDHFIKRIGNKLLISLWMNKRIYIDYKSKKISLYRDPYKKFHKNFLIPESKLLKCAEELSGQEIFRIKKYYSNADALIFNILNQKLEKNYVNKENLSDFLMSTKNLKKMTRTSILESFVNNYKIDWESLIESNLFKIYPKHTGSILDYKFSITEVHQKKILAIKTNPSDKFFELKLEYKNFVSPEFTTRYLIKRIDKGDPDFLKFYYLKNFKSKEIVKQVLNAWKFESIDDTLDLISYLQKSSTKHFQEFSNILKERINDLNLSKQIEICEILTEDYIVDSISKELKRGYVKDNFFLLKRAFSIVSPTEQQKKELLNLFLLKWQEIEQEQVCEIINYFLKQEYSFNEEILDSFLNMLEDCSDFESYLLITEINEIKKRI